MEYDLLTPYDNFNLGVVAYKRLAPKHYVFYYINKIGTDIDNFDISFINSPILDIYPEFESYGLIDHLENVFHTGKDVILPFTTYETPSGQVIFRANKIKKIGEDIILNIYNDESDTYAYISDMKYNHSRLNDALNFISHDIRGEVTTSLGILELLKTKCSKSSDTEVEASLKIVQKNMENIDFKIHSLVNILYHKTANLEEVE